MKTHGDYTPKAWLREGSAYLGSLPCFLPLIRTYAATIRPWGTDTETGDKGKKKKGAWHTVGAPLN